MEDFWNGFVKNAEKAKKKKEPEGLRDQITPSLSGAILGYGLGTALANKAYGNPGSHLFTPLAGMIAGSRAGSLLYDSVRKRQKEG